MPLFRVTVRGTMPVTSITEEYDIEADSSLEAQSIAVADLAVDWPGVTACFVHECTQVGLVGLYPDSSSRGYSPYGSTGQSGTVTPEEPSGYTPYGAGVTQTPVATPGTGYTPYSSATTQRTASASVAGFTASHDSEPTEAVSYHKTLSNGYAPFRSFRLKVS